MFSIEDLRMLAAAEREMDAGKVPWVRVEGASARAVMAPEIMDLLGLVSGQTVSWTLWGEIIRLTLKVCQEQLDAEVAANTARLEDEVSHG